MTHAKAYWEQRAKSEGLTYGENPSMAARLALPFLKDNKKSLNILEIGGGYGRNALFFAHNNCKVTNIDLCEKWINSAYQNNNVRNINADILKFDLSHFDGAFSNFVLHFFRKDKLEIIFKKIYGCLPGNGLFINSWLSEKDRYAYSDSLEGKIYMHCFEQEELKKIHSQTGFKLEVITQLKELELINNKAHITVFWFTAARKA